ncbi:MAG: hypothetical protein WAO28_04390 [Candidatus Microsaccharimonas sp.]
MQANKTVTINGRRYDAVTGLPITKTAEPKKTVAKAPTAKPSAQKRSGHVAATSIHASPERSHTLHRRSAKKPASVTKRPKPGVHMDIARHGNVTRFAPHPVAVAAPKKAEVPDVKPRTNPIVAKALSRSAPAKVVELTPKQIKDQAIASALAKPSAKQPTSRKGIQWSRRFTIMTASFVILILGAFLTYTNLPSLSVGFASSQAGIRATYPEYRPDGFSLEQPISYRDGEVTLRFVSNSGTGDYAITQTRSSWDSSAVLDNVVRKNAGDNYITTQERGLTIYSYDSTVVWVNGSILYTIKSTAPLSGEQIRRIATSL